MIPGGVPFVVAVVSAAAGGDSALGGAVAQMQIEAFEPQPQPERSDSEPEVAAPPQDEPVEAEAAPPDADVHAAAEPEAEADSSGPSAAQWVEEIEDPRGTEGPAGPTVKLAGRVRGSLGVDTWFDSPRGASNAENVVDGRARVQVAADIALSQRWRLMLEGRGRWRGTAQRAFDRSKALYEAELGEAFLDFYSPAVDVRVGQQVFALGANAAGAPTDVLNPRDLREGLFADPADVKLAVFGARATGELGPVRWLAAYVPFFQPHRYTVFGQDEALVQPASAQPLPDDLHPSVEDQLQPHLLETERPAAALWNGDVALQLRAEVLGVRLGASYAFVHEKLPQVFVDSELARVLEDAAESRPLDPAEALSVQNRLRAGEKLFRGTYPRQHVVGVDAMTLVGPTQLDVDLGWSPRQSFATDRFESVRRTTFSWAIAVTPAEDSDVIYALSWSGLAVRRVPADDRLFLLEPATAKGRERTAWFHLFAGELGHAFLDDTLQASLRFGFEPVVGSFLLQPMVRYELSDRVRALAWAELWQGKSKSAFGYFARNDQVVAAIEADLF